MTDALMPCPFCGSQTLKVNETSTRAFVECLACKARGPKHESQWEGRPFAEHNWNARRREARLEKEAEWLAKNCQGECQCPYFAFQWGDPPSNKRPDWCVGVDPVDDYFDCDEDVAECWRMAARNAVEAQNVRTSD